MRIREFLKGVDPSKCSIGTYYYDGLPNCPLAHGLYTRDKYTKYTTQTGRRAIREYGISAAVENIFYSTYSRKFYDPAKRAEALELAIQAAEEVENELSAV